ncbi:F-box/LRR-repeat protein At3g48880-like [Cornus florida]|uniref:F-box/LRR-repeat protein At3g48880-like n=1 Tax=Cornus florida TaxID=4283 RepID=UPI0028A14828|nr:F-box/LRR-repeat protein At3g48880-like [Cornus florida]XP_059630356.1 F-box/LRR-repeat protein At3g48880-like [Cornus florida]
MEERKWEELNMDCLVNIFGRVGMMSLLFDVSLVCKSWYTATLNPLCWQHLIFPPDILDSIRSRLVYKNGMIRFDEPGFIKFVISRSGGFAVKLVLPDDYAREALVCVAEGCPALKYLTLPNNFWEDMSIIPSLISKWKNLEMLRLGSSSNMEAILTQVSIHCNNFVGLGISGAYIGENKACVLVTLLPNIKYLALRQASLKRENLVTILEGCKKLVFFDARDCVGFECDDEILNLASHIPTFMYEGSREWSDDENFYSISPDPDVYGGYNSG